MSLSASTFARLLALLSGVGFNTDVAAQLNLQPTDKWFEGKLVYSDEEEALYLRRHDRALARRTTEEIYDTREAIAGAPLWAPLPAAQPRKRTIAQATLDDASRYAAANNSSALIVWRNGKVESETYFGGRTRTTPIVSNSLSKPLTSVAVGRAIMLGYIKSLDQPVADFITEWRGDALRERMLVRHLLDMRSGFLRQGTSRGASDILSRSFLHPRHDEIIVREYPVVDEPGKRYEYNNAAYDIVAVLIERATRRRYAEFVGTEVLQKIGAMGGTVWLNRDGGMAHAGCCALLPAETFLRLAILTLRDGIWEGVRLLPESYVSEMRSATAENPHYGLGIFVAGRYVERRGFANPDLAYPKTLHAEPFLAGDLYLFDGNGNQVIYVIPSQDLVILRTGNAPPSANGVEWDNSYLPNSIMRGIVKDRRRSLPQQRQGSTSPASTARWLLRGAAPRDRAALAGLAR